MHQLFLYETESECFDDDLSDTQDGLKCWRMGIIFYGKHPFLLTRIQVSDPVSMGPLV